VSISVLVSGHPAATQYSS